MESFIILNFSKISAITAIVLKIRSVKYVASGETAECIKVFGRKYCRKSECTENNSNAW
jgi:hypothetical protein